LTNACWTCAYKAILSADDPDTQEYFSLLAGTYRRIVPGFGSSASAFLGMPQGNSTNFQEQETRLIKPHELGIGILKDRIVLFTPNSTQYKQQLTQHEYDNLPSGYKVDTPLVSFMHVDKVSYKDL